MKKIIQFILVVFLASCQNSNKKQAIAYASDTTNRVDTKRILFVTSNAHHYGNSDIESTNHFPEIILAYEEFKKEGFIIDFVSPKGGAIPIGYIYSSDSLTKKYLYDEMFMNQLEHTKSPNDIDFKKYKAVYYTGGGSAMFTVPESKAIQEISKNIYEKNEGVVSAICHGTAGIADIRLSNGTYLISDRKITGFPDLFENKKGKYYQEFPFSIQERVARNGGNFTYSKEGWDNYFLTDGRVITGQDPTGSASVAKEVIKAIRTQQNISSK